jgi:hypothetical protein
LNELAVAVKVLHRFLNKFLEIAKMQILDDASPALSGMDSIATSRTTKTTFDVKKVLPLKLVDQIY